MPEFKSNEKRIQDFKIQGNSTKIQQTNRLIQEMELRLKRNVVKSQTKISGALSNEKRNINIANNSPIQKMRSSQHNQPSHQLIRLRKRNQQMRQKLNNYSFGFTRMLNERIKQIQKDCLRSELIQLQTLQARKQQLLKQRNRLLGTF